MNALNERRNQDIRKVRELVGRSAGKVDIMQVSGDPIDRITLELRYTTAPSNRYPSIRAEKTVVIINLPSRYPLQPPVAEIRTPILHPNVFPSGKVCLGQWLPTETLDLLVRRIIQIVIFDPAVLNETSPANGLALQWYRQALATHPDDFPTDRATFEVEASKKTVTWKDTAPEVGEKVIVKCPSCSKQLRVPKGKTLKVSCPSCSSQFGVTT